MSPSPSAGPLRTFAVGAPGEDLWAVGWFPAPGTDGVLVIGAGAAAQAREARLAPGNGAWAVAAEGAELVVDGASAEAAVSGTAGPVDGFEQAATATGTVDGGVLDARGRRGERPDDGEVAKADSVREIASWFEGDEVVTVTALRPRKAKGHGQDTVHAAVVQEDGHAPVVDPRLSTTYTAQGRPRRVALELWSEDEEAPALRLVAEALGRGATVSGPGWELAVDWLVAHRRGRDGMGVYTVARPA